MHVVSTDSVWLVFIERSIAAVFTTIGANSGPTSTIQAIALRTADYISNNARTLLT